MSWGIRRVGWVRVFIWRNSSLPRDGGKKMKSPPGGLKLTVSNFYVSNQNLNKNSTQFT